MKFIFGDLVEATNTIYGVTGHSTYWLVVSDVQGHYMTVVGYDCKGKSQDLKKKLMLPVMETLREKRRELRNLEPFTIAHQLSHLLKTRDINHHWHLEVYDVDINQFTMHIPMIIDNKVGKKRLTKLGDDFEVG